MIVRESCCCGATIEFDERDTGTVSADRRLAAFRDGHQHVTPENTAPGEVQPEATANVSGASPGAVCECGHADTMHEPTQGKCWASVVTHGASATGSLSCGCHKYREVES